MAQNQFDLGSSHKLMLGVRRDNTDIDGSKFLRGPDTNEEMFKEPVQSNGVIKDFSKAAGQEH